VTKQKRSQAMCQMAMCVWAVALAVLQQVTPTLKQSTGCVHEQWRVLQQAHKSQRRDIALEQMFNRQSLFNRYFIPGRVTKQKRSQAMCQMAMCVWAVALAVLRKQ
jgi:hypothetical protein